MNFISTMLSDSTAVSSKRVITLLAFIVCASAFVSSIIGYHVDSKLFDSMMYIVIAGLSLTASEKFAPTK